MSTVFLQRKEKIAVADFESDNPNPINEGAKSDYETYVLNSPRLQILSSTLYKNTTTGLNGKPCDTESVGGDRASG